jgi:hypothetical protein
MAHYGVEEITVNVRKMLKKVCWLFRNKLGKNEEEIPQFFLESKIIAPILPRILTLDKFKMLQILETLHLM